jgi:ribonucleoside-diphosphate reductase alpha chain
LGEIAATGSCQGIAGVPDDVKRLFVTAFDIAPEWHLRMQAAFQKYTDNAVSKTVNLPKSASVGDVRDIYRKAVELKLKGITVYRYGSRADQPLTFVTGESSRASEPVFDSEWTGNCRYCAQ